MERVIEEINGNGYAAMLAQHEVRLCHLEKRSALLEQKLAGINNWLMTIAGGVILALILMVVDLASGG